MRLDIEKLRALLEIRNVGGFLLGYQDYRARHGIDPVVTGLTQRVFPPLLRDAFTADVLDAPAIVLLWRLVRDSRLLLVENDFIVGINLRINDALKLVQPHMKVPVQALATFDDLKPDSAPRRASPSSSTREADVPVTEVKRLSIASAFTIGTWSAVDAFNFRKNLCASQQECEFLRAVRQFFPTSRAYPNQPLRNFIDIEKLDATVPVRARSYAWSAQVDVLICTEDEDPVLGIELDSLHHDNEEAAERDDLKNFCSSLLDFHLCEFARPIPGLFGPKIFMIC